MESKYRDKVRKLLALAMSDNPHEAERARSQAIAMMRKYNIAEGDIDIITLQSKPIMRRQNPKYAEMQLLNCIREISGCELYYYSDDDPPSVRPVFIGLSHDVKLADYTWELLIGQLLDDRAKFRDANKGISRRQLDLYCDAWVKGVTQKIHRVFKHRPPSEKVLAVYARETDDFIETRAKQPQLNPNMKTDKNTARQGKLSGKNARLFQPTGQDSPSQRVTFIEHEK